GGAGGDRRARPERERLRLPRDDTRERRQEGARESGASAGGHRRLGDQRGVRVGDAELDSDARHRRGPGQRQRRRGRPRTPDRRLRRADPRQHRPRAAPRRRLRLRRDLLRRGAGRRGHPEGLRRVVEAGRNGAAPRGAAFFDLDKTLMAGSSGIFFARAAYETGMISRSRLVRDVYENVRFRLLGSTDDRADDVRRRVGEMIKGVRVRDLERLSPRVLSGVLPRLYPQMLERAYAHQDAGEPVYILTAASQEMADLLARVLAFDGGLGSRSEIVDGHYTGRPAGPFNYRE